MSIPEGIIAKYTFLFGAPFFLVASIGNYHSIWGYPLSESAPTFLNFAVRLFWGVGFICLFTNLAVMWRDMIHRQNWGWFISTFFGVFFVSLLYYKAQYEKHGAKNI